MLQGEASRWRGQSGRSCCHQRDQLCEVRRVEQPRGFTHTKQVELHFPDRTTVRLQHPSQRGPWTSASRSMKTVLLSREVAGRTRWSRIVSGRQWRPRTGWRRARQRTACCRLGWEMAREDRCGQGRGRKQTTKGDEAETTPSMKGEEGKKKDRKSCKGR